MFPARVQSLTSVFSNSETTEKCALPRPVLDPKAPPLASKTRLTTVLVKAYLT